MPVTIEVTSHGLGQDVTSTVQAETATLSEFKKRLGPLGFMFTEKNLKGLGVDAPVVLKDLAGHPKFTVRIKSFSFDK